MTTTEALFPAFAQFARETRLQEVAKGNLSAKLPRIFGQGATRAVGLDLPPAEIERKVELASIVFPDGVVPPPAVQSEIDQAHRDVESLKAELRKQEGLRRFAVRCIQSASAESGLKDGQWFAERLILVPRKGGMEWAWCVTPHYSIVDRIPADHDYVVAAFAAAKARIRALTVPVGEFERRLRIAWLLAREFASNDDVLVTDVMKMYQVAGQDTTFWQSPKRQTYKDLPEAAFAVNLINWRQARSTGGGFEFVPATLHQAHGPNARVFFMPMNAEGTEVRPMVYLRRSARDV
jgi:hypothetical protein